MVTFGGFYEIHNKMNVIYKGARLIKDMYNQLNPATLTGAIDILVIEQEDEELVSSPFHVRFGKLGVLRAREKVVNITINDEVVDLHMKLGEQGEAFFVEETCGEEVPSCLITSPLPSRPVSPVEEASEPGDISRSTSIDDSSTKQRKRRKRRKRPSLSNEAWTDSSSASDDDVLILPNVDPNACPKQKHPVEPQLSLDLQGAAKPPKFRLAYCPNSGTYSTSVSLSSEMSSDEGPTQIKRLCSVFSDSELPPGNEGRYSPEATTPFSDSEALDREQEVSTPVGWNWGELPDEKSESLSMTKFVASKLVIEHEKRQSGKSRNQSAPPVSGPPECNGVEHDDVNADEPDTIFENDSPIPPSPKEGSPKKNSKRPSQGLYLDEILDLEPNEANRYLSTKHDDKLDVQDTPKESRSITPEENTFIGSDAGVDSGTDCVISEDTSDSTIDTSSLSMKISLCGGKLEDGKLVVDEEKFLDKLVTYEQFAADPYSITQNSDLIIQLAERYCDWEAAGPLLLSMCVFKKPLSNDTLERMIHKQISKKARMASSSRLSWFWRRGSQRDSTSSTHTNNEEAKSDIYVKDKEANEQPANTPVKQSLGKSLSCVPNVDTEQNKSDESSSADDEIAAIEKGRQDLKRAKTVQLLFPQSPTKTMRKTTRLTSDQLKSLKLKPGANTVMFSVISQYQGTSKCYANIYLWKYTDQLVVSDIDGTITKSDVFGQILPVVGKDWTQGGVAQLYDNISRNGYKFIYLSARAIGQAGMTKGYLNWINQQGVSLPPGPLFLSPTSLISAFRAEVIEKKPEKFKIQCLKDIKALFPEGTRPLAAGFGNKKNDVVAYTAVGIPERRVFTINPRGELTPEDMQTYTTSYSALGDIVDNFFPAPDSNKSIDFCDGHEFSEFNYWRGEMPDVVIEE